eukprot:5062745-Amphidinium_carterae.1
MARSLAASELLGTANKRNSSIWIPVKNRSIVSAWQECCGACGFVLQWRSVVLHVLADSRYG